MKKTIIIISLMLITGLAYPQVQWYPQNSGTNSYLFDICFADQYNGWASGVTGLILHTNDGGTNWYSLNPPPNNSYYSLCFTDSQTGWASGYGGKIIHTTDGGTTWTDQNSGSDTDLYDIFFINENEGWVVGGDNGVYPSFIEHREVLHTTDGGNNWTAQINQAYESLLFDVHFLDQNIGFAVGESGHILHTSNGGNNWVEQMSDQFYHFYSVFFVNASTGFVVGVYLGLPHVSVIFSTFDGGTTWTPQTFGTDETLSDIFFVDEDNGWAVGGTATSSIILNTTDGGVNWEYIESGTDKSLSSVYFIDNNTGWAAGYLGTIISTYFPTGINSPESDVSLLVCPNPASNKISVDISSFSQEQVTLIILNSIGQIVYRSEEELNAQTAILNINTCSFSDGLYTVILEGSSEIASQKVIIRR